MKKVVIGCLAVALLVAVAGGFGAYYFIYRPAKSMVGSVAQLQDVPKIATQVRNRAPFTPPSNGELTGEAVDRFMKAQEAIKARLGERVKDLDAKYKAMSGADDNAPASFGDAMSAMKDLGALVIEAKRVQVDALNQHGFSLAEYEWVRGAVYAAAGVPVQADFTEFVQKASRGEVTSAETMTEAAGGEVPEANRALVAPHVKVLTENVGLAFFGL